MTDAERIRRVVLPANYWGHLECTLNNVKSQALNDILTTGLRAIAAARLRDYLQEQPMARTVALADYSVSTLISWSADTASSRGSLAFDRDDIVLWYKTSAVHAVMAARGKEFDEFIGNRLFCLAAKHHGIKLAEDATKLITLLEADGNTSLGAELIARLAYIAKALEAKKDDKTVNMSDI